MSTVTDIILITAIDDSDEITLKFGLKKIEGSCMGGTKAMQCDVLMSAMNEYEAEQHDILEWFFNIEVSAVDCIQLFIKEEHEDTFNAYTRGT